jgi:DNA-binding winged helix-turn-helix (wHTH) protein/tetratricopeptide (TPR) repeat protein
LVVVTGPAGVGKTALAREFVTTAPYRNAAYVRCEQHDRVETIVARAERALDIVPGMLKQVMATEPRLLVLDELHRLSPDASARLLDGFFDGVGDKDAQATPVAVMGRVLGLSRDVLPLRRGDSARTDLKLTGLAVDDARMLWSRLEEVFGPTPQAACDAAIERTRGVPLALRREYARAAVDKKAWDVSGLPESERRVLCAASVLRLPATPAALGVLLPSVAIEKALRELVRRQLIDQLPDGRLEVHDVVRASALEALSKTERCTLELGCAALLDDEDPRAVAWEQTDGAALAVAEPVDRLREAVRHLVEANELEKAEQRLLSSEALAARRGGGGEVLALLALFKDAGRSSAALTSLEIGVLARLGRVAEALELFDSLERDATDHESIAPELRLTAAELSLLQGDVAQAQARVRSLSDHIVPDVRARGLLVLARVEVERGNLEAARKKIKVAIDSDKGRQSAGLKARLRLLLALIDERDGQQAAARQILSRMSTMASLSSGTDHEAEVSAALSGCLAEEGRLTEAEQSLAVAERAAREHDRPALGDEIRRRRAVVLTLAGRLRDAESALRDLSEKARARGDELSALRAEAELARVLLGRGRSKEASQLTQSMSAAASQRGLAVLAADARVARAEAELDELRLPSASELASTVVTDSLATGRARERARRLLLRVSAWNDKTPLDLIPAGPDASLEDLLCAAEITVVRGDAVRALELYREVALHCERAGRRAELSRALAEVARLHLARGERPEAENAATRALSEGVSCGTDRAIARALLVRAALARDEGDLEVARASATDAFTVARAASLSIETYSCAAAAELICREAGDSASATLTGEHAYYARCGAAATLTQAARTAADRLLHDLGLIPARPFRMISAAGTSSYVAEVDPAMHRMDDRDLVIDGVRELILRSGKPVADLRRRSLLKKLLFLFCASPGKTFSKEDIVKRVWCVDYHPLRHDAALFTNIMRLRRLLGAQGEEILRVGEGGYRLVPPADFLFVDRTQTTHAD